MFLYVRSQQGLRIITLITSHDETQKDIMKNIREIVPLLTNNSYPHKRLNQQDHTQRDSNERGLQNYFHMHKVDPSSGL